MSYADMFADYSGQYSEETVYCLSYLSKTDQKHEVNPKDDPDYFDFPPQNRKEAYLLLQESRGKLILKND